MLEMLFGITIKKSILTLYPDSKIIGHCDVEPKKPNCPGFNVVKWFTEAIPSIDRP